jgi:hypothetical protein
VASYPVRFVCGGATVSILLYDSLYAPIHSVRMIQSQVIRIVIESHSVSRSEIVSLILFASECSSLVLGFGEKSNGKRYDDCCLVLKTLAVVLNLKGFV